MVQSEQSENNSKMLTLNSSDPFARKQGQSGMCGKSVGATMNSPAFKSTPPQPQPQQQSSSSSAKSGQQSQQQHGSWGPVFKNKDHFASMHFC